MAGKLYKCPICGLHYHDMKNAKDCENFCRKYHGTSFDISKMSVEHQKFVADQAKNEED